MSFSDKGKKKSRRFVKTNGPKRDCKKEIAEIIIDDDTRTVREVHYVREEMIISSNSSDEENTLEDNHDRLDLTDQSFEMIYCQNCKYSERLIVYQKDQRCERCDLLLQFKCERCDKTYKGLKALRFHLKHDCAKVPGFKCAQCDYKTTRKASLQTHIKCRHTYVTKRHACATCGRQFKHRFHMLSHQRHCGPENNIRCQWCSYTTDNKWGYKQHVRNIHTDPEKLEFYVCITCGKKYKHLNSLKKHKNVCSFKGTCAHCGLETSRKSSLLTHIKKTHASELFDSLQIVMPTMIDVQIEEPAEPETQIKKKRSKKTTNGLQEVAKETNVPEVLNESNSRKARKKSVPKRYTD